MYREVRESQDLRGNRKSLFKGFDRGRTECRQSVKIKAGGHNQPGVTRKTKGFPSGRKTLSGKRSSGSEEGVMNSKSLGKKSGVIGTASRKKIGKAKRFFSLGRGHGT